MKAKEGTYEFTIKSAGKTVTVTVNVVDVTMPKFKQFKVLNSEEVVSISDKAVQDNTEEVKTATGNISNNTFSGNVNLMTVSEDGGKYYKARIEVEKYDNTKIQAVNQKTLKEYKTEPVTGAANEIYVYLDANEAEIPLVLKHVDATNKQVKDAKATTVKFNTTSTIWPNFTEAGRNYYQYRNTIVKAEVNPVNNQIIDVGVNFDQLPKATFTVNDNGEVIDWKEDSSKGEKWIALSLKLTNKTGEDARTITNAVHTDNTNIILDKAQAEEQWRWVWLRAEGEGTVKFTLKYTLADNKVEELPITVNLHDTKAPEVEAVTSNTTGVINAKINDAGTEITVDSYKYGMDANAERKESADSKVATKGRWYSLSLETNIDVSSLVYADEDGNWAEIPEEMISDGKLIVWLNADETDDLATGSGETVITLANRYTVKVGDSANGGVNVIVKRTEKSKVELNNTEYAVSKSNIIDDTPLDKLYLRGITVVENELENAKVNSNSYKEGTLQYNLTASQTAKINTPLAGDENGVRTTTLTINSHDVSTIKVNGVEGKWIVVHMTVSGNIDTLVDETNDASSIIIDPTNIQLLQSATNGNEVRVPIWINLSSDAVKSVTNAGNKTLEVKFGSTAPVVEHNEFKLKVVDENPMEDEVQAEEPASIDRDEYLSEDGTADGSKVYKDFGWGSYTDDTDKRVEALLANMKVMEEADIRITDMVDDTVYVSVKANLDELKKCNDGGKTRIRIPLTFDVSSLSTKKGDKLIEVGINGTTCACDNNCTQTGSSEHIVKMNFTDDLLTALQNGKVTKEFLIIANPDHNTISTTTTTDLYKQIAKMKYVRYVVTFENN